MTHVFDDGSEECCSGLCTVLHGGQCYTCRCCNRMVRWNERDDHCPGPRQLGSTLYEVRRAMTVLRNQIQ